MCEFLKRARLRDTQTDEVREWSTMPHRVVELCGPFPTPDDRRAELWLHEESATRLLDMCDRIDAEFDRTKTENTKLRESVRNLLICIKHEECEESCPNYEPMYTDYGYEKNGSTVVESEYLGCCAVGLENCNSMLFDTDEYLRELGIEV